MKNSNQIVITKASGVQESFSSEKLKRSLVNAGASEELSELIADEVQPKLYPGISTKKSTGLHTICSLNNLAQWLQNII